MAICRSEMWPTTSTASATIRRVWIWATINSFSTRKPASDWHHVADNNAIHRVYLSGAIANREPNRNDFVDRRDLDAPKAESLFDLETGYILAGPTYRLEATGYAMEYKDQLVPTGALNDVGALLRTNVDRSFRRGIELAAESRVGQHWSLFANATFSNNRIAAFEEVLYDYLDYSEVKTLYTNTPIAFSPAFIGQCHPQICMDRRCDGSSESRKPMWPFAPRRWDANFWTTRASSRAV